MKNIVRFFLHSIFFFGFSLFSMEGHKPFFYGVSVVATESNKPQQGTREAKYFFHQQINDMCMIAPMLNLKLLELTKTPQGSYDFSKVASYSRREWMALNISHLLKWHGIIEGLNHPLGKQKYPHLIRFIENAKEYGPVFPHFYDRKGNFLLSNALRDVLSGTLQAPYFLIDFNAIKRFNFTIFGWELFSMGELGPALGLFLPIFNTKDTNKFYIPAITGQYPFQHVDFEPFPLSYTPNGDIDLSQFSDARYGDLSNVANIKRTKAHFLGFDEVLKTIGTGRGYLTYEIPQGQEGKKSEFLTFALGLYQLMLLTLGITETQNTYKDIFQDDEEKLKIDKKEEELVENTEKAINDIQQCLADDPSNPWHASYFSKDNFLQHAIATILKENPILFEQTKAVADFYFPVWKTYNDYLNRMAKGECFNAQKQKYYVNLVKHFLPSEEYVMAYALTQGAWFLSIGGINNDAFYKALTNDTGYLRSLLINVNWSDFKKRAFEKKQMGVEDQLLSFIDVWKNIVSLLAQKYDRKNWISFSGHGMIISFDGNLIEEQKKMPNNDQGLLDELGFAIIDSWLGTELNTFYKK